MNPYTSPTLTPQQLLQQLKICLTEATKVANTLEAYALLQSPVDRVDVIGQIRDCLNTLEATESILKPAFKRTSDALCREMLSQVMNGDENGLQRKSRDYLVRPDVEMGFQVPTIGNDPDGFKAMHRLLGTPEHYIDSGPVLTERGNEPTEVLKINWKGLQTRLRVLVGSGKELPYPFDKNRTWTEYKLTIRALQREGRNDDE